MKEARAPVMLSPGDHGTGFRMYSKFMAVWLKVLCDVLDKVRYLGLVYGTGGGC